MVQFMSRSRQDIENVYKLGFQPGRKVYSLEKIIEYLDDAGYHHPTRLSWARAFQLVVRCQSGLLSYEKYGVASLRTFAAARGVLTIGEGAQRPVRTARKADIVKVLEVADNEMTFRLMELPPELRNYIYIAYFDTLPALPRRFVQPPLCLASRALRDDTLKVFYARCTFTLTFHVEGHRFRGHDSATYGVSTDSAMFDNLPPDCFSYMTRFAVNLLPRMRRRGATPASVGTWRVAIDGDTGEAHSTLPPREIVIDGVWNPRDRIDVLDDDFVASLAQWAEVVARRPGLHKLKAGDIDTLRLALQQVVYDKRFPWLGALPRRSPVPPRGSRLGVRCCGPYAFGW